MYQVLKVLNNNTILAKEDDNEIIVMAKGIGFGKKVNEHFEIPPHAKKYMMQKNYQAKDKQKKVIDYINPVYLEIAAEIIKEATNKFEQVNHDILIPLADHIYFAIKRMDENIMPTNPFTYDIRLLFPDEYEVALKSKEIIKSFINKEINNDEVGFITLHIHSAISSNKVGESMEAARVVHESIIKLQTDLNMKIDVESISYARLMNHIKFLIIRLNTNEQLQMDISEFTKNKFPFAYEQAIRMCDNLSKVLHKELPESEQEIMMIIWEYEEPVSRFQVEEKLNVEKNVAPSTILTLLTRLEKKGFIQKVRNGKSNLYVPLVEKENYIGTVGKNMLDKMFQGSLAKFASALYDGEKLSSKEVKQLQEFIDRQK